MVGSAIPTFILFAVTITLLEFSANGESVRRENEANNPTRMMNRIRNAAVPPGRRSSQMSAKATELPPPAVESSHEGEVVIGDRYGVVAPKQCKPNQVYTDGACRETSSL